MKIILKISMICGLLLSLFGTMQAARKYAPGVAMRMATTGDFDISEKDQILADIPEAWKKEHRSIVNQIKRGKRGRGARKIEMDSSEKEEDFKIEEMGDRGTEKEGIDKTRDLIDFGAKEDVENTTSGGIATDNEEDVNRLELEIQNLEMSVKSIVVTNEADMPIACRFYYLDNDVKSSVNKNTKKTLKKSLVKIDQDKNVLHGIGSTFNIDPKKMQTLSYNVTHNIFTAKPYYIYLVIIEKNQSSHLKGSLSVEDITNWFDKESQITLVNNNGMNFISNHKYAK